MPIKSRKKERTRTGGNRKGEKEDCLSCRRYVVDLTRKISHLPSGTDEFWKDTE